MVIPRQSNRAVAAAAQQSSTTATTTTNITTRPAFDFPRERERTQKQEHMRRRSDSVAAEVIKIDVITRALAPEKRERSCS